MKDATGETKDQKLIRIEKEANDFLDDLGTFKITNKEDFDLAATHLETIAGFKKVFTDWWAPVIEAAFNVKKAATTSLRVSRDKEEECLLRSSNAHAKLLRLRLTYKTAQDKADADLREKEQAKAEAAAKRESAKLLKKAEKVVDPVREEALIEKADEVKVAPVFIPKTVNKSERTASGTLNTFVPVIEVEVHDVKSICGMIFKGDLPVNVVSVSEMKIKAWAKMFDKPVGMYNGFNINKTEKERITSSRSVK
jgi:hypothetical protein